VSDEVGDPATWRLAGSLVIHKMLGELSYEGLLEPEPLDDGDRGAYRSWRLPLPGEVSYEFKARRAAFDSWSVAAGTATRRVGSAPPVPADDPRTLVVDARAELGLSGRPLVEVLASLTAAVTSEATRLETAPTAEKLSAMDYNLADGHLSPHPRLVVDESRAWFSASDNSLYAPESGSDIQLRWFAVHREHARFRAGGELTEQLLLREELDAEQQAEFTVKVSEVGDPADYQWLPVHPWQADEIVSTRYAGELADGTLVDLGPSRDHYRPHQTVSTLANVSRPHRHDVGTTLSLRGLEAAATRTGPAVTAWLNRVSASDAVLSDEYRFELLGEVAGLSVRHPLLASLAETEAPGETLDVVWREPLVARLADDEQAISFAALPYRDLDGDTVIGELIRRSGWSAERWCARVFDLLLTPMLRWLVRYGVGFQPRNHNLVLVVGDAGRPLRVALKDFAQGVGLVDQERDCYALLDDDTRAHLPRRPAHLLAQSLSGPVLAGQLRFWAEVLDHDLDLPRARFWPLVRQTVAQFREANPELAERFDDCRLFAPRVKRATPNRAHLTGKEFAGALRDDVPNPLHAPDPAGAW
jgi:siderophore synthetase component